TLALEDEVGTQVGRLTSLLRIAHEATRGASGLHQGAITLYPQRVDGEEGRLTPVVEGTQKDLDVVVAEYAIPIGESDPDRGCWVAMALVGADAEVDCRRRVPDEHGRRVVGRPAVGRRVLPEISHDSRQRPDRLIQSTVHLDACVDSRRLDVDSR